LFSGAHDPQSASSGSNYRAEVEGIGVSNSRQQRQDIDLLMNKRMKESNSGMQNIWPLRMMIIFIERFRSAYLKIASILPNP
jgi:hypothetical protein